MTLCLVVTVAIAQQPEEVAPTPEHRVELVTTDAVRLVYLEHDGPYWAAGAKFAGVREYMSSHDQPGPMFMLYHRSTRDAKRRTPVSLIGFIATAAHVPSDPFQVKTIPARRVLRLTVEGKASWPGRPLKTIAEWAVDNGHAASGEVLEIYHLALGAAGRIERTEFQLPLAARSTVAPNDEPNRDRPASDPVSPPVTHARPTGTKPVAATVPRVSVGSTSEAGPPNDKFIDSIPALVRAARYGRVAELLLSDAQLIDREEQVWIGQVIFRIKAAGRGVERKYSKTDGATTALAEALLDRYGALFKDRPVNPLSAATPASSAGAGSLATQRRAIMRRFDGLLSRIAFGAAGPDAVVEEIAKQLEHARRVLEE